MATISLPSEVEVWVILPALRREIARVLHEEHDLSQKKVAEILGVSEGAISQYLSSKRGSEVTFDAPILVDIRKSAALVKEHPEQITGELMRLLHTAGISQLICQIHKKKDITLKKSECNICFEQNYL